MSESERRHVAEVMRRIGRNLRWAREIVEPNRSQFARRIGVDVSTLRNVENGSRGASVPLIRLITHTLKLPWAYVMDSNINPEPFDVELLGQIVTAHPELRQPENPDNPGNHRRRKRSSPAGIARTEAQRPRR